MGIAFMAKETDLTLDLATLQRPSSHWQAFMGADGDDR